ncbi:MAG: hypothetical protein MUP15_05725 [Dehalococcoidia bacterium]|nr:hypothetical protein [Dehalococcoidia bacterium]
MLTATRLVLFPLLAAIASILLVSCGSGARDEGPAPTLDQVHERMKVSSTREGYILHNTSVIRGEGDEGSYNAAIEIWLDVQHDLGRTSYQDADGNRIQIVAGSRSWDTDALSDPEPAEAEPCFGNEHALCLLWEGAMGGGQQSTPAISRHDGRLVVDLPFQSEFALLDVAFQIEGHLYLDQSTFLPVSGAFEFAGESGGTPTAASFVVEFGEYDFLPSGSLPDDLFDPKSIGFVTPAS